MRFFRLLLSSAILLFITIIRTYAQYEVVYAPRLQSETVELSKVKAHIVSLITNVDYVIDDKNKERFFPKDFLVLADRIEFKRGSKSAVILFSEMTNSTLTVQKHTYGTLLNPAMKKTDYIVDFDNLIEFWFLSGEYDYAKSLADDLYAIQYKSSIELWEKWITAFEPLAEKYRTLKVKPQVSEGLRKYIVQAEAYTQQKEYNKAIELYQKAIAIDPIAYPAVYSNLALLSAQVSNFNAAIYYMKKYLMLEPESPDARSMKDKIYGWELRYLK